MKSEKKSFDVEIKALSEDKGEVRAVVSVFGNVDSYNDRMMAGSFANTLAEWKASGNPIPFIWSHEWDNPDSFIGEVIEAQETQEGLEVLAKVDLDRPKANQVFHLLKSRRVTQFSFGYIARDWEFVSEDEYGQVRQVKDVQLLEVGPTLLGANQATRLIQAASAFARKATADEVAEGVFVSWVVGDETYYGRIEYVMTEGMFGIPESEYSIEASAEDPAILIRLFEQSETGWEEEEYLIGARASQVSVIDPLIVETDSAKAPELKFDTPAWMQDNARRGLDWYAEGLGGDGLERRTIEEARDIASGRITEDKAIRMRAWFARHMVDLDAPDADPDSEDFPSAGVVAHALWGGGTKPQSERAYAWAEDRVAELEREEEESSATLEQKSSTSENDVDVVAGDTSATIDQERLMRLLTTTRYSER